jgi:hypothetical protein
MHRLPWWAGQGIQTRCLKKRRLRERFLHEITFPQGKGHRIQTGALDLADTTPEFLGVVYVVMKIHDSRFNPMDPKHEMEKVSLGVRNDSGI